MIFFNEQTMNTKQYSLEQIIEMARDAEFQYKLDQLDIAREDFEFMRNTYMPISESVTAINEGVFSTIGNIISAIFNAIKKFFASVYNFFFSSSTESNSKEEKVEKTNKDIGNIVALASNKVNDGSYNEKITNTLVGSISHSINQCSASSVEAVKANAEKIIIKSNLPEEDKKKITDSIKAATGKPISTIKIYDFDFNLLKNPIVTVDLYKTFTEKAKKSFQEFFEEVINEYGDDISKEPMEVKIKFITEVCSKVKDRIKLVLIDSVSTHIPCSKDDSLDDIAKKYYNCIIKNELEIKPNVELLNKFKSNLKPIEEIFKSQSSTINILEKYLKDEYTDKLSHVVMKLFDISENEINEDQASRLLFDKMYNIVRFLAQSAVKFLYSYINAVKEYKICLQRIESAI